jgi:hypothetical protein
MPDAAGDRINFGVILPSSNGAIDGSVRDRIRYLASRREG